MEKNNLLITTSYNYIKFKGLVSFLNLLEKNPELLSNNVTDSFFKALIKNPKVYQRLIGVKAVKFICNTQFEDAKDIEKCTK